MAAAFSEDGRRNRGPLKVRRICERRGYVYYLFNVPSAGGMCSQEIPGNPEDPNSRRGARIRRNMGDVSPGSIFVRGAVDWILIWNCLFKVVRVDVAYYFSVGRVGVVCCNGRCGDLDWMLDFLLGVYCFLWWFGYGLKVDWDVLFVMCRFGYNKMLFVNESWTKENLYMFNNLKFIKRTYLYNLLLSKYTVQTWFFQYKLVFSIQNGRKIFKYERKSFFTSICINSKRRDFSKKI